MTADLQKEVLAMDEQAFYKVTYGLYVVSAEAAALLTHFSRSLRSPYGWR